MGGSRMEIKFTTKTDYQVFKDYWMFSLFEKKGPNGKMNAFAKFVTVLCILVGIAGNRKNTLGDNLVLGENFRSKIKNQILDQGEFDILAGHKKQTLEITACGNNAKLGAFL